MAAVGGVVDEVENAAAAGDLVLPPVVGPAFVGPGAPRLALELLLPGRELGGVARELVVGGCQRVRLLCGPSGPVIGDALVGGDHLPLVGARRTGDSFGAGQC